MGHGTWDEMSMSSHPTWQPHPANDTVHQTILKNTFFRRKKICIVRYITQSRKCTKGQSPYDRYSNIMDQPREPKAQSPIFHVPICLPLPGPCFQSSPSCLRCNNAPDARRLCAITLNPVPLTAHDPFRSIAFGLRQARIGHISTSLVGIHNQ